MSPYYIRFPVPRQVFCNFFPPSGRGGFLRRRGPVGSLFKGRRNLPFQIANGGTPRRCRATAKPCWSPPALGRQLALVKGTNSEFDNCVPFGKGKSFVLLPKQGNVSLSLLRLLKRESDGKREERPVGSGAPHRKRRCMAVNQACGLTFSVKRTSAPAPPRAKPEGCTETGARGELGVVRPECLIGI